MKSNMCKNEGKTNTVAKVDENKKIEEICDYIFKYEHYNTFYQYAVACAKAVAEWKNRETVDKAVEYLKIHMPFGEVDLAYRNTIIEDFKQSMMEEI